MKKMAAPMGKKALSKKDDAPMLKMASIGSKKMPAKKKKNASKLMEYDDFADAIDTLNDQIDVTSNLNILPSLDMDFQILEPRLVPSKHLTVKNTKEKTIKLRPTLIKSNPVHSIPFVCSELQKEGQIEIDLSGQETLSDMFFYMMREHNSEKPFSGVVSLGLAGCLHITDFSLAIIAQIFPNLQSIDLSFCLKVTETGLHQLVSKCLGMNKVNIQGTDVALLPYKMAEIDVNTNGYPCMSPDLKNLKLSNVKGLMSTDAYKKSEGEDIAKLCIIHGDESAQSLMKHMKNEKDVSLDHLQHAINFKLSTRFTVNIVECHESLSDLFISKRGLYIFPVSDKENQDKAVKRIFGMMCHILNKTQKAVFLVAGLASSSSANVDVLSIQTKLNALAAEVSQNLKKKIAEESTDILKSSDNILGKQQGLVRKVLLHTALKSISVETVLIDMSSPFKQTSSVESCLVKLCELYPEYQEMAAPVIKILKSNTIDKTLENGVAAIQKSHPGQQKLMDMYAMMGRVVSVDIFQDVKVLMQLEWLGNVIKTAYNPPPDSLNKGRIREVQDNLTLWMPTNLLEQLKTKMTPSQAENGQQILAKLGLSFTKAIFPFKNLPDKPVRPIEEFFPELGATKKDQDKLYTCGFTIDFYGTVPSFILHKLLYLRLKVRSPTLVWQSGMIGQEGLVETLIQLKTSDKGAQSCLEVYAHTAKKLYDDDLAVNCVTNTLMEYKLMLDFILHENNIPHNITYHGQTVDSSMLICRHKMATIKDEEGKQLRQTACQMCGQTATAASLYWELFGASSPPAVLDDSAILSRGELTQKDKTGSIITLPEADGTVKVVIDSVISAIENSTFTVGLLHNCHTLQVGLGYCFNHVTKEMKRSIVLDFEKKAIVHQGDEGTSGELVASLTANQLPAPGDLLTFRLSLSPEESVSKLTVFRNTELIASALIPTKIYAGVVIKTNKDVMAPIFIPPVLNMSVCEMNELSPGMRLEALDRKTPTLICVATVQEIMQDGKLLIHFDGWNNNYDYLAEPDSPDLHPIGWFSANVGTPLTERYNQNLQAPRGYGGNFTWKKYLEDNNFLPVPFGWFNESQVNQAQPDFEESILGQKLVMTGSSKNFRPCVSVQKIARRFELSALKKCVMSRELFEFFTNHSKFFCLLPRLLSVTSLQYPSLVSVVDASQQSVHILCPGMKMEVLHFVDHEGVKLTKPDSLAEMAQYLQFCYCGMLFQEDLVPKVCTRLISGMTPSIPEERYEDWMQRLCFLYQTVLEPLVQVNQSLKVPKVVLDIYGEAMADQKLSVLFSGSDLFPMCVSHSHSVMANSDLSQIPMEKLGAMMKVIATLDFSSNKIEELPEDLFSKFVSLEQLTMPHNHIQKLPPGIGKLALLTHVDVSQNRLESLPDDLDGLKNVLEYLNISGNPLKVLPTVVFTLNQLKELHAENIGEVPDKSFKQIKNLSNLEVLNLGKNLISSIPDELGDLPLVSLDLSGVPWVPMTPFQSYRAFSQSLNTNHVTAALTEQERQALFKRADVDESSTLTQDEVTVLNYEHLLTKFPRFGRGPLAYESTGGIPPAIFRLKSLRRLILQYHAIKLVPDDVKNLTSLNEISLSCNPKIVEISAQMGTLPIKHLGLQQCPTLNTPPKEVVARGVMSIMGYLKRLQLGAAPCKRTKLMLVGLGGAGKTSVAQSLMNSRYRAYMDRDEPITDGIDISKWQIPIEGKTDDLLTFSVWDFAGQTVYYNTHQFFLSNRAVYLLLWNVRQGYEHAGLDFWLSSIACHAPKAPILVVGTHIDKVEKYKLPEAVLQARYPQICGFNYVSSYNGIGVEELRKTIISQALKQKYMGERIPEAWLSLEKKLIQHHDQNSVDIMPLKTLETFSNSCGIISKTEMIQAVQFLHDLGAVQFFNTDFLRNMVVINPQWIIDVMACLVTVHQGAVKAGKLMRTDIGKVWDQYPADLQPWLLRLTEEFDLTCPLLNEEASIVPCLLPDEEPEYDWPQCDPQRNVHESMIMYKFVYLPAGLFNRAQVRLNHFSEGAMLWKKGSYLKKNQHIALMLQTDDQEVIVRAQGFRPENFLFLVHEMFETLIAESYTGVRYDFLMPCTDCLNMNVKDPSMVSYNKVQRGLELNVPFLQCDKFFHILSMQEIVESMPSNRLSDMDSHLRQSVRELINLTEGATLSCFFAFSSKNVPSPDQEATLVSPNTILKDLQDEGSFSVSYTDKPETLDMEALTLSLKSSNVIIIGMSDEFCDNESCTKLLMYVKDVLRKPVLLLLLGTTKRWRDGHLSLSFGTEVYVDMQNKQRYPHKIKELFDAINKKAAVMQRVKEDLPNCFISYCWTNSHDAIAKGSRKQEGSLGWEGSDPRLVKNFLQEKGVNCWIDIERVGGSGLFHSIADGLREAEVMVAFVSDEYVKSKNCVMEFRYGLSSLRVPVIVVVVGTGYEWERSEVGLLAVGNKCDKVNLQYQNEAGYLQLLGLIQEKLSNIQDNKMSSVDNQRSTALQEVLELTQRKFLRHMTSAVISSDAEPYPSLIVVDFLPDSAREAMVKTIRETEIERIKQQRVAERKEKEKKEGISEKEQEKKESESEILVEDVKFPSRFCFKLLCENSEGWHPTEACIPFPVFDQSEEKQFIDNIAPYLSRVYAIAKHSKIELECLITPEGQVFQQRLEEIGMRSASDFRAEYHSLRQMVMEQDNKFSSQHHLPHLKQALSKCQVNGKTLWLCETHKQATRSKTEKQYQDKLGQPDIPLPANDYLEPEMQEANQEKEVVSSSSRGTHRKIFKKSSEAVSKPALNRQTSQMCSVM